MEFSFSFFSYVSGVAELEHSIKVRFFHSKSCLKTRVHEVIGSDLDWGTSSLD
jgi:hypothetical protein